MQFSDYFKTNYLRAEDLGGKDMILTIKDVQGKPFEDDIKPVAGFDETQKGLILNRTNFRSIAQLYGDSTDLWIGKKITCFQPKFHFVGTRLWQSGSNSPCPKQHTPWTRRRPPFKRNLGRI